MANQPEAPCEPARRARRHRDPLPGEIPRKIPVFARDFTVLIPDSSLPIPTVERAGIRPDSVSIRTFLDPY